MAVARTKKGGTIKSVVTHYADGRTERQQAGPIILPTVANRPPPPQEPTLRELITNFAGAMRRWQEAGFRIVTREVYRHRRARCRSCPAGYWDGKVRLGLGKCKAPGCGCTKLKLFLASESCPLPPPSQQWGQITDPRHLL